MPFDIAITTPGMLVEGVIEDSRCGVAVASGLPIEDRITVWGGEISILTPMRLSSDETATYEPEIGDICYCSSTGSLIFYCDTTPMSTEGVPVARYLMNRIGKITEGIEFLQRLRPAMTIRVSWGI